MIYYDSSLYIPGFILIWTYIRTDGKTFLPLWSITVTVSWNDKVSQNIDLRHGLFLPSGTYFGHCSSIISNRNCSKIDFIHLHLPQKFPTSPGFPGFYIEILSFYWKNHWRKKTLVTILSFQTQLGWEKDPPGASSQILRISWPSAFPETSASWYGVFLFAMSGPKSFGLQAGGMKQWVMCDNYSTSFPYGCFRKLGYPKMDGL